MKPIKEKVQPAVDAARCVGDAALFVGMIGGFFIKLGLSKLKLCKKPEFRITG